MNSVYSSSPIKTKRRTKAQVEQLDQQILQVLQLDHPQSVRHVFYRMTDPRLMEPVEKSERGYRQVQNRIVLLRRSRQLPFGWITDATRRGYFTDTYSSAAEFVREMSGFYRADLWKNSSYYCEVWTESRSIAGVIQSECDDLAVSLYPAGGFTSISLAYQAAEYINATIRGRDAVIFYIGDYDPAGVLIDRSLEKEIREHLDRDISLSFVRLGITEEQIKKYDLPTKPRKPTDRRSLHIQETVEAEAMPAATLRALIRDRIESLLPADALRISKIAEDSEREHLENMADFLEGKA